MNEILCLDAGSSSLKYAAYLHDGTSENLACRTSGETPAGADADAALRAVLERAGDSFAAVGHRLVFGGPTYAQPVRADASVLADIERLVEIEPLHLRAELDLVYAAQRRLPDAAQILCFDTAFHRRMPAIAKRLPLPREADPLLERYGFHGLSYEYVASQLDRASGRTIAAHLGAGASLCAMRDGAPVDTTMGFSALGGLMMATRPGDLDPGVFLRLLADGYAPAELTDLFYRRSGLVALAGSADMKALLERYDSDDAAREAVDLFNYQLAKQMGAMVAVLGGLDTLVFTGGIGERAPAIRTAACRRLAYLGVRLDIAANARGDRVASERTSKVRVLVIPANENLVIARHVAAMLSRPSTSSG